MSQERSLTLNDEQLKQLEAIIQDMPTKYGLTLLNLFRTIAEDAQKQQQAEAEAFKPALEESSKNGVKAPTKQSTKNI